MFLASCRIESNIAVASFFVCNLFLSFTYPFGVSKNTAPSGVLYAVVPLLTFLLVVGTNKTSSSCKSTSSTSPASCTDVLAFSSI